MLEWLKKDRVAHALAGDKSARKIVGALPYSDPVRTLEEAHGWLLSIGQTASFKPQRRFEVLELLDGATLRSQQQAVEIYLSLPANDERIKRVWRTASEFWKRLGDGYLTCARQAGNSEAASGAFRPQLPRVAVLGLRALRHQMKWVSLRYAAPRGELWSECGRFVRLAESVNGASARVVLFSDASTQSSSYEEMLRLMMFNAAMPGGLAPLEQDIAERLVARVAPELRCDTQFTDNHDYFFELDGTRPPLRWVPGAPASAATRYVDVSEARGALHALYSGLMRTGNMPADINLSPIAEPNLVTRVLRHLLIHWAKAATPRAASRQKTDDHLDAVCGFENVLNVLMSEQLNADGRKPLLETEDWIAADTSPGGCGVIVRDGKGESLRVGVLVALRSEHDTPWCVGIVRRVAQQREGQHHLGVQVLSRAAVPVQLRTLTGVRQNRAHERCILLNEQAGGGDRFYVLARRDLFSTREVVEATYGPQSLVLMLEPAGDIESGPDFDWLQYKRPSIVH